MRLFNKVMYILFLLILPILTLYLLREKVSYCGYPYYPLFVLFFVMPFILKFKKYNALSILLLFLTLLFLYLSMDNFRILNINVEEYVIIIGKVFLLLVSLYFIFKSIKNNDLSFTLYSLIILGRAILSLIDYPYSIRFIRGFIYFDDLLIYCSFIINYFLFENVLIKNNKGKKVKYNANLALVLWFFFGFLGFERLYVKSKYRLTYFHVTTLLILSFVAYLSITVHPLILNRNLLFAIFIGLILVIKLSFMLYSLFELVSKNSMTKYT